MDASLLSQAGAVAGLLVSLVAFLRRLVRG